MTKTHQSTNCEKELFKWERIIYRFMLYLSHNESSGCHRLAVGTVTRICLLLFFFLKWFLVLADYQLVQDNTKAPSKATRKRKAQETMDSFLCKHKASECGVREWRRTSRNEDGEVIAQGRRCGKCDAYVSRLQNLAGQHHCNIRFSFSCSSLLYVALLKLCDGLAMR